MVLLSNCIDKTWTCCKSFSGAFCIILGSFAFQGMTRPATGKVKRHGSIVTDNRTEAEVAIFDTQECR